MVDLYSKILNQLQACYFRWPFVFRYSIVNVLRQVDHREIERGILVSDVGSQCAATPLYELTKA